MAGLGKPKGYMSTPRTQSTKSSFTMESTVGVGSSLGSLQRVLSKGTLYIHAMGCRGLSKAFFDGTTGPYLSITMDKAQRFKTDTDANGGINPIWKQVFTFQVTPSQIASGHILFQVKNKGVKSKITGSSSVIGAGKVKLQSLMLSNRKLVIPLRVPGNMSPAGDLDITVRFDPLVEGGVFTDERKSIMCQPEADPHHRSVERLASRVPPHYDQREDVGDGRQTDHNAEDPRQRVGNPRIGPPRDQDRRRNHEGNLGLPPRIPGWKSKEMPPEANNSSRWRQDTNSRRDQASRYAAGILPSAENSRVQSERRSQPDYYGRDVYQEAPVAGDNFGRALPEFRDDQAYETYRRMYDNNSARVEENDRVRAASKLEVYNERSTGLSYRENLPNGGYASDSDAIRPRRIEQRSDVSGDKVYTKRRGGNGYTSEGELIGSTLLVPSTEMTPTSPSKVGYLCGCAGPKHPPAYHSLADDEETVISMLSEAAGDWWERRKSKGKDRRRRSRRA